MLELRGHLGNFSAKSTLKKQKTETLQMSCSVKEAGNEGLPHGTVQMKSKPGHSLHGNGAFLHPDQGGHAHLWL